MSLALLLQALGVTVATAVAAPAGTDGAIGSVVLLEAADLGAPVASGDLAVLIGVAATDAVAWLDRLRSAEAGLRPLAVATKQLSTELRDAAERAGVALVAVHPQARVELVLATVRSLLDGGAGQAVTGDPADEPLAGENDLYGLAQTVASLTGGLVSIEDDRSRLLAYSATDGAADELRMLSILGRAGPADYLRRLRQRGIFDRLRTERRAIEVPADDELGWRRRLVVDIRQLASGEGPQRRAAGTSLGTIWIQEGRLPLEPDAESVLEGAAAIAARLIERARSAPTQEALQIQRLLGLRGGSVDIPSLAASLSLPSTGPSAVIGIARRRSDERRLDGSGTGRRRRRRRTTARECVRTGVPGGHHRHPDLRAHPARPGGRPRSLDRRDAGSADPPDTVSTCAQPSPRRSLPWPTSAQPGPRSTGSSTDRAVSASPPWPSPARRCCWGRSPIWSRQTTSSVIPGCRH